MVYGIICLIGIIAIGLYYIFFFKPKNSLELYQELSFSDSFEQVQQKLMLDGYESNISKEDFHYIQNHIPDRVGQFTLLEFNEKSYVIMTSPGTEKLKIVAVEELPEHMREFFLKIPFQ